MTTSRNRNETFLSKQSVDQRLMLREVFASGGYDMIGISLERGKDGVMWIFGG